MISFPIVRDEAGAARIEALAREIWTEHYVPLIGAAQVAYMLDRFQAAEAILEQINDGMRYHLIDHDGEAAGYLAYRPEPEAGRLFLSKLYVRKECRGQGLARKALTLAEEACRDAGLGVVALTVNKNNAGSIAAYKRLGFRTAESVTIDIDGGFVMDDYRMEKKLDFDQT